MGNTALRISVWLLAGLLIWPLYGEAATYQWRDKNGKLHFSDKPPPASAVESKEISDQLKDTNTDNSARQVRQQLDQVRRDQSARSKEQTDTTQPDNQRQQQLAQQCAQARRDLRVLRGRVIFFDENGNEERVTEEERARRAAVLEQRIKEQCP